MSVNKVILIGNLGADPELKYLPSGQAVCEFRIATSERWTGKDGQQKESTEWHRIKVWGKQGEGCKEYLSKGRQVYVEGGLRTRSWDDKEGKKHYTTEVVAQRVQFLGGRGGGGASGAAGGGGGAGGGREFGPPADEPPDLPADAEDDGIPF
jgi:single-strand DNA-binding protein